MFLIILFSFILVGCGNKDDKKVTTNGIVTTVYSVGTDKESLDSSSDKIDNSDKDSDDKTSSDKETTKKDETTKKVVETDGDTTEFITTVIWNTTTVIESIADTTQRTTQEKTNPPTVAETTTQKPIEYNISLYIPNASGTKVQTMNGYTIDYSNTKSGYVMVKSTANMKTYIWIEKDGMKYQFKMQNTGEYEVYPLTMGNGAYSVRVLEVASDGLGYDKNTVTFNANFGNANAPYLYASSLVNFYYGAKVVNQAYELTAGVNGDAAKVEKIYNYIKKNISYNYDRASSITSGALKNYVPSPDNTLSTKQGICSDYASTMAAMCRSIGIPAKMIYGYVNNNQYHAWNQVYYGGLWHFYDSCIAATGGSASGYIEDKNY